MVWSANIWNTGVPPMFMIRSIFGMEHFGLSRKGTGNYRNKHGQTLGTPLWQLLVTTTRRDNRTMENGGLDCITVAETVWGNRIRRKLEVLSKKSTK